MITTARLHLRPPRASDAAALFEAMRDPEVMRYWSCPPHSRLEDTQVFMEKMRAACAAGEDDFVVEHRGEVVGKAGFWRQSEIGFLFRREVWGRGLAKEALHGLIERGFFVRRFTHIRAEVDPENERCLRLLRRLGFSVVRFVPKTLQIEGEWRDSVELTLAPEAWRRP